MKKRNYKGLLHKNAMSIIEIMLMASDNNNVVRGISIERIFALANLDLATLYDGINLLGWMQNQKYIKIITEGNTFAYEILKNNLILTDKSKDIEKPIPLNTNKSYIVALKKIGLKLIEKSKLEGNITSKSIEAFLESLKRLEPKFDSKQILYDLISFSFIEVLREKPFCEIRVNANNIKQNGYLKSDDIEKSQKTNHSFHPDSSKNELKDELHPYELDIIKSSAINHSKKIDLIKPIILDTNNSDLRRIGLKLIKRSNSLSNIVSKHREKFLELLKYLEPKFDSQKLLDELIASCLINVLREYPFFEIHVNSDIIKIYSSMQSGDIEKAPKPAYPFEPNYSKYELRELKDKLRPYQLDIVEDIANTGDDTIIELPTGSGKTFIALHIIINELQKGGQVLFLAPKLILIEQALEEFKHLNPYRIYGSHFNTAHNLLVSTLHTMANRKIPSDLTLLIVDEAHYGHNQQMQKVIKQNLNCRKIALSATPYDFEGNLIDGYDKHINKYGMQYMLENKYLVPYNFFKILNVDLSDITIMRGDYNLHELYDMYKGIESSNAIVENTIIHIKNRKKIIVFAINILHSIALAEEFKNFGINSKAIHSKLSKAEQSDILKNFKNGDIKILVSIEQLTTGFDAPIADTIIFARPTKSFNLYQQMVGRVLRPFSDKNDALLLDCAGLIDSLGLPDKRGLPVDLSKYDLTHLALNKYRIKPKKKNNFLYENYLKDMERFGASKPYMSLDEFQESIDKRKQQTESFHADETSEEITGNILNEVNAQRNINHKIHYFSSKSEIEIPKIMAESDIHSDATTEYKQPDSLLDISSIDKNKATNDFFSSDSHEDSSLVYEENPSAIISSTTLLSKIEQHSKTVAQVDVELNPYVINPYEYIKSYIQQVKDNKLDQNDDKVKIVKSFFIEKGSQLVRAKVKEFLYQNYKGHCQICGFTFAKVKDTKNYFEVFNWQDHRIVTSKKYMTTADSLCLCSNCANNIKWGSFEAKFLDKLRFDQINDIELLINVFHVSSDHKSPKIFQELIEFNDIYVLEIIINNNLEYIYFTHEHLVQFLVYLELEKEELL